MDPEPPAPRPQPETRREPAPLGQAPESVARPEPGGSVSMGLPAPHAERDDGPTTGDALFERLDPRYVRAERLSGALLLAVLMIAGLVALVIAALSNAPPFRILTAIVGAAALLALLFALQLWFWPAWEFRHTRYALRPESLEIRRGVLFRRWIAVPRSRVQHTDVSSGPIQRRFGIGTLTVHTAGTTSASVALAGLPEARARQLRDELMRGLERSEDDGV